MKNLSFTKFVSLCSLLFAGFALSNPLMCSFYTKKALEICANSLLPALLPFVFLSRIYANTSKSESSFLSGIFSKLFGVDKSLSIPVFLGLFFGFPSGAISASSCYKKGLCTKTQAENAIALSNNCSAPFLINVAGAVILQNVRYGIYLFASQIISVLSLSVIMRILYSGDKDCDYYFCGYHKQSNPETSLSVIFTDSIKISAQNMLYVCAFTVFFYLISGIICDTLQSFLPGFDSLKALICGALEITSGVFACKSLDFPMNIILCSIICSFAGMSVMFQICAICNEYDLSIKKFIVSRFILSALSPLFTLLLLVFFPPFVSNFVLILYLVLIIILCAFVVSLFQLCLNKNNTVKSAKNNCRKRA